MISVVIPVYNGERFIAAAIRSVLAQTLRPDQIIVADDGSTDASGQIAASFDGVTVLALPHRGGSAALNSALAVTSADFIAFLDADDLWAERKLELQAAAFAETPSTDAVFGKVVNFNDPQGRVASPSQVPDGLPEFVGASKNAMLVSRQAFDKVGAFDESIVVADFPEWYGRALTRGTSMRFLDDVVAFRRIHGGNATLRNRDTAHKEYLRTVREAIARRRAGESSNEPFA
jgi:glycosyltransferase involved in cell wall biosynthesis